MLSKFAKIIKNGFRGLGKKGYTLVEVAAVVAVTATLAAVALPVVKGKIDEGKKIKAQQEVNMIGAAIICFIKDTGRYPFYTAATATGIPLTDDVAIEVLVTADGDDAAQALLIADWVGSAKEDTLDNQLITNIPGYERESLDTTEDFVWRGPYVPALNKDPWGTMYYCNIQHFAQNDTDAVWVLSAGPDKEIDTPFDQETGSAGSATATDVRLQDDDIGFRLK